MTIMGHIWLYGSNILDELLPFAIAAAESRTNMIARGPSLFARLSLRLDLR